MIPFKEWLDLQDKISKELDYNSKNIDEDWRKFAKNSAVGAALAGAGLFGLSQTNNPNNPQDQQQVQLQNGLQQASNGQWVYVADAPNNDQMRNVIIKKAHNAYIQQTGSGMQGVQWGVKEVGDKIGIWFK